MDRYATEIWSELVDGYDRSQYRIEGKRQFDNKKPWFWVRIVGAHEASIHNSFDDTEFAMRVWCRFKDTNPTSKEIAYFTCLGYKKLPTLVADMAWETLLESKPTMELMKSVASGFGNNGEPRVVRAMDWVLDRDKHYRTLGFVDNLINHNWGGEPCGTEMEIAKVREKLEKLWNVKYPATLRIAKRVPVMPIWNLTDALNKGNYTRGDLEAGLNTTIRQWFADGRRFREHCYTHFPIRECEEAGSDKPAEVFVLEQCRYLKSQEKNERADSILRREMDRMGLRPAPAGYLLGYAVKDWNITKGELRVYALGTHCWTEDDEYPAGRRYFYLGLEKWMTAPGSADECIAGTHVPKELRALDSIHPDIWPDGGLGYFYLALRKDAKIKGKPLPEEKDPNPQRERYAYSSTAGGIGRSVYNLNPAIFPGLR